MAISLQRVIRSISCFVLDGVFGDGGSNGAIFDSNKFKMAAAAILDNFEWPYLHNSSRSTYIAFLLLLFSICHCAVNWCGKLRFYIHKLICCFSASSGYRTRLVSKHGHTAKVTIRPGFSGTVPLFNLKSRKKIRGLPGRQFVPFLAWRPGFVPI